MKRRVIAWGPSGAVLIAGLAPWLAVFSDKDAFALRALSIAVAVALLASAPSWLIARAALGYLAAFAVKVAIFFALAPSGIKTLGTSYEELGRLMEDWLLYFWATPPLMLAVTVTESWLIGVRLSRRSLRETPLWRWRRPLAAVLGAGMLIGLVWWFVRVDYYLSRIKSGHAPARYSLAQVGPRALPRIYREIHGLGRAEVGAYRSDLVSVLKDIRHRVVARQIRSPLVWEVEGALIETDPAMVDAVRTAMRDEPKRKELERMSNWADGLDFNTKLDVFCSAFDELAPERRGELVTLIASSSKYATLDLAQPRDRSDTSYPFRDLSKPEILEIQAQMRRKLACVPARLVSALEHSLASWLPEQRPSWAVESVRVLGRLRPWPPELTVRIERLLLLSNDGYFVGQLFEQLARELGSRERGGIRSALKRLYPRLTQESARTALLLWILDNGRSHGLRSDAFFCDVFESSAEDDQRKLMTLITDLKAPDPCVATLLMATLEKQMLETPGSRSLVSTLVRLELQKLKGKDPRIPRWARQLMPRVEKRDGRRLEELL